VLLAVASGASPHARSYFTGSHRALQMFLRLLRGYSAQTTSVALNIVWILAYNHQRALALLRRLQAREAIEAAVAGRPSSELVALSGPEADYERVMLTQLRAVLE